MGLAALVVVVGVGLLALAPSVARALEHQDTLPTVADYIVVLGNRSVAGNLSPQGIERLREARRLLGEYPDALLVVSGGESAPGIIESRLMKAHLVARSVPTSQVIEESSSRNTLENLANTQCLLTPSNSSVIIVTNGYHSLRVRRLALALNMRVYLRAPVDDSVRQPRSIREQLEGAYWVYRELGALVLTHTHAGVDALRRRFQRRGVPAAKYRLSTIAGFCLRYASSYPATSGLTVTQPLEPDEWTETYAAGARLFLEEHTSAVLKASFSGVFVDEYQDCTKDQHRVVRRLADLLPCRVLGDPLQGIFSFGGALVNWPEDVASYFPEMDEPNVPWRWRKEGANGILGDWLVDVRRRLRAGESVDLSDLPAGVKRFEGTSENRRKQLWGGMLVGRVICGDPQRN